MKSFNDFRELLDHEFRNVEPLVSMYGIRLDKSDGVKEAFGLQDLKSADYFANIKDTDIVLEFSDLGSQVDRVLNQIAEIKKSDISSGLKKEVAGNFRKSVAQEARNKYVSTCLLFSTLRDNCQDRVTDVPELPDGCKFIVVYAPFRDELSTSDTDIARFIEYMRDNLVTMIPDEICNKVEVLPLDLFKHRYEPKQPQPTDAQS